MAGAGWRQFAREVLEPEDVQGYLMDQAVMAFDSVSQRDTELPVQEAGMVAYMRDTDRYLGRTPSSGGGITGGVWRGLARHWGTTAGALPSAVSGNAATASPGDMVYSSLWRCNAVVSYSYNWRQIGHAEVGSIAGRNTLATDAAAGGAPFHEGFRVYVTGNGRFYAFMADGTWRLLGGRAGTVVNLTTGTGAPATGWVGAGYSGTLQHHGDGMATVNADVVRSGANITPSTTGKITNVSVLTLPSGWEARLGTTLGPGLAGNRPAFGYIGTTSNVLSLTSVGGTADIATGATISLSGTYALATPQDLND